MSGILRGCRLVLSTLLVVVAGEPASAQLRLDNLLGVYYADDLIIDELTAMGGNSLSDWRARPHALFPAERT